ncbi:hypothetical protein LOC67_17250 [Stieleria sp. JC731]|uniref:hypothetical protein n=1 Tax=Pirellulaceae TaxID=2691357 RepID=UPI001E48696C|nr:hypothetical protein [Stieleria sp. JC731]MCC9602304.1 hypothetical protein [Stieleria sp. JC731]
MENSSKFVAFRFSVKVLLVVVFVAAAGFGGYREGVEAGRRQGPVVPKDISDTKIYSRDYDVSDLATSEEELKILRDAVIGTAMPEQWASNGGMAELSYKVDESLLQVSHVWPGHIAVVRFLRIFREFAQQSNSFEEAIENTCGNY